VQEEDDKLLEEIIELPGYHTLTMELLIKTAEADSKRLPEYCNIRRPMGLTSPR
jgi:hypothetical protein